MKHHGYISSASGDIAPDGRPICIVEISTSHRGGAPLAAHRAEAERLLRRVGFEVPTLSDRAEHDRGETPDAVHWTFRALPSRGAR